ncbi:glycosyltransferase family 4 protein [Myceligenerans crystallogenes]|uniref:Glycosyltransferase family 4 protein n=1 Tax=Myceligenerans crystallogenes TaxID=316335 RepID=A0ABN2N9C8_9MICO
MRTDPGHYDLTVALTYYVPYVSGLTEVARAVAEGMASRGARVAVATTRHDPAAPARERVNGVDLYRTPVVARVGRGVISPRFTTVARALARRSDVLNVHLPLLEAGLLTLGLPGTAVVATHHDDVWLPSSVTGRLQTAVVDRSVARALRDSAAVVVNNEDHAAGSRHRHLMERAGLTAVPPPCRVRERAAATFRDGPGPHFGFLGRLAPEKALDLAVRAFRTLEDPTARLIIAGEDTRVAGGGVATELRALAAGDTRVRFPGFLTDAQVNELYSSLDAFVLPSVAEESFGISQVEAMMLGVPSIASDLPGMRQPVLTTGFGRLFEAGDVAALAATMTEVAALDPAARAAGAERARGLYGADACLDRYEALFARLAAERRPAGAGPVRARDRDA